MPAAATDDTTKTLRPYIAHHLDLVVKDGQAYADCCFCGREGKFTVEVETGLWRCYVCQTGSAKGGGNAFTFLRTLHGLGVKTTSEARYRELADHRRLLNWETLRDWGVVVSPAGGEWLVPGYGTDGGLNQLYRYGPPPGKPDGKWTLLATPGLHHQLFGLPAFDPAAPEVWVCEGPWDGMALWEAMGLCKRGPDGRLVRTGDPTASLRASTSVIAVPGCSTFHEGWSSLLAGRRVTLAYDSDHPREFPRGSGKHTEPAGHAGCKRVTGLLAAATEKPALVSYLSWGAGGYDPDQPSGYDVRDFLTGSGGTVPARVSALGQLLGATEPAPPEWAAAGGTGGTAGSVKLEPERCTDWRTLQTAWRKAMQWTDGLDVALSVMLAAVTSTKAVGDQLWVRVISPPSCLDGDTPIYDPTDRSVHAVRQRTEHGKPFHVFSRTDRGGIIVCEAEAPKEYAKTALYDVRFLSGRVIRVTRHHRLWDGENYTEVHRLADDLNDRGPRLVPLVASPSWFVPPDRGNRHPHAEPANVMSTSSYAGSPVTADAILSVTYACDAPYYDFHVPTTNNYWACGFFHHNTGKSTLCEALAVADKYVVSKSTLRGFLSGYDDGSGSDFSLISQLRDRTFVLKDGDTLLTQENLPQILAEARDLFDTTIRSSYRSAASRDYTGVRMTWILCGTSSLRLLDTSELGERFLTCSIMDDIDDDLEDEILWRTVNRAARGMAYEVNGAAESRQDAALTAAMRLTGGYVEYLRTRASALMSALDPPPEAVLRRITRLAKFVAFMRARPSVKQEEQTDRELASRLASQMTRLPFCLAAVLGRRGLDDEVMRRTTKVAMDTAKGRVLEVCRYLYDKGEAGAEVKAIVGHCNSTPEKKGVLLRFLRKLGAVDVAQGTIGPGVKGAYKWFLTPKMRKLYADVMTPYEES